MDSFDLTYVQYDQEACTNYWNYVSCALSIEQYDPSSRSV